MNEPAESLRSSPIRGWGALDDISTASQSPVRTCDPEASHAARAAMSGIFGQGTGSMRAVCASTDDNVGDGRTTPIDTDVHF